MLAQSHFYNKVIKKAVAIFGTCFNNITIGRTNADGTVISNIERVPISYGPKQKWLARITQQKDLEATKIAIKVPRLSFEMTGIEYDSAIKLNRLNRLSQPIEGDSTRRANQFQAVPYKLTFQLYIYGRNQDDVLQIMEQILPQFQPEYAVSAEDFEAPDVISYIPIVLNGIGLSDDYEADLATRRTIIYTLTFTMHVRFSGPTSNSSIIKFTQTSLTPNMPVSSDSTQEPVEYVHVSVGANDTPTSYTIHTSIDTFGFD
jgi:hypothetical protein